MCRFIAEGFEKSFLHPFHGHFLSPSTPLTQLPSLPPLMVPVAPLLRLPDISCNVRMFGQPLVPLATPLEDPEEDPNGGCMDASVIVGSCGTPMRRSCPLCESIGGPRLSKESWRCRSPTHSSSDLPLLPPPPPPPPPPPLLPPPPPPPAPWFAPSLDVGHSS